MAPEPVYNNLRAIIEKLDVRRAQVFVEALIVEVSADKAAEFGIQWQALSGYNSTQTRVIGGTNFTPRGSGNNIIDVAVNPGTVGQGLALGVMKGTVTIPGLGTITNLAFLARALETQIGANILSTPTLLTLDNEEARIIVGQNMPLITGSYATTGSTNDGDAVPDDRAQGRRHRAARQAADHRGRHDPPRALPGGVARRRTSTTQGGVILSKRALESTVVVDDTQIIVLGGLIEDRLTDGSDKVPLFGDIPLAGALFRYDARRRAEDEPDDLHQADGAAHERRRTRDHVGALPVPAGRAGAAGAAQPALLGRPDAAHAAAAGHARPARPGADPTPPLLGDRPRRAARRASPAAPPAKP